MNLHYKIEFTYIYMIFQIIITVNINKMKTPADKEKLAAELLPSYPVYIRALLVQAKKDYDLYEKTTDDENVTHTIDTIHGHMLTTLYLEAIDEVTYNGSYYKCLPFVGSLYNPAPDKRHVFRQLADICRHNGHLVLWHVTTDIPKHIDDNSAIEDPNKIVQIAPKNTMNLFEQLKNGGITVKLDTSNYDGVNIIIRVRRWSKHMMVEEQHVSQALIKSVYDAFDNHGYYRSEVHVDKNYFIGDDAKLSILASITNRIGLTSYVQPMEYKHLMSLFNMIGACSSIQAVVGKDNGYCVQIDRLLTF